MQTGTINVQTENIFPIIKKFLYSDHEIFLRELVSNAVDATQKLKTLASMGKVKDEMGDLTIHVEVDKKNKQIRIIDRGIGMTSEEVDKYINQIAFSSAEEFVKKYKGKSDADKNALIGHFGLGFYSAFMVAEKVEIRTKTYKKGGATKAVKWECDGSPNFTMDDIDKNDRGTEIILHVAKDSEEFLEEYRILELLRKYSKFLPVPIQCGMEKTSEPTGEKDKDGHDQYKEVEKPRIINNTKPAWTQKPADLKDEDYKNFYRELYPMNFEEPLFHIHLNVDYPFNLTGILYFPKVKKNIEVQRDKIQLYSNQVFVTDSVEGIVPDFLTLLHGVIDSPDIPLNVSRSYLQSDSNVKKISNHIMKKVGDKLEELFKNNREDFEKKWDDIKVFIEYGMISEEKFYERAEKFAMFKNTDGKYFTFDEYKKHVEKTQLDKDKKLIYLYTTDTDEQHAFIETAKSRGYDVMIMSGVLDNHFINTLEQKFENTSFARVDADIIDKLIKKEEDQPSKLDEKDQEKLKPVFEKFVNKENYNISFESLSETDQPVIITQPEFMRRMKDMSKLGGGMDYMGTLPDSYNLVINSNHKLISEILNEKDTAKQDTLVKQVTDLARLSQNLLKGQELTDFIKRSVEMIGK
ncbi:MAG TPA: molecular chaperone HtpG [Bacteroidales bacterium]|mgnify:CR=1 FL=1|nr:molecular chaperone HtpG [Bacteroidales bacterium]HRX95829.1 molecular chaperone HtpG [Bacteroidales bacterium]